MAKAVLVTTAKAECPFFKMHTLVYVSCESALCSGGIAKHSFPNKKAKDDFMKDNCCKDRGEGCVYYNAIMLRYEQE